MELLSLPTARLSLEFATDELPLVMSGLRMAARRFRKPVQAISKQHATHREIRIGGARFVLMTDDGDPALLSMSVHGDALLRTAVDAISACRHRDPVPLPAQEYAC